MSRLSKSKRVKFLLIVFSIVLFSCNLLTPSAVPGASTPESAAPAGETSSSEPLPTATELPQGPWVARNLAWSPDQTYLVVATDQGLNFHEPASKKLAFRKLQDEPIRELGFSHNGKMLAAGGEKAFLLDTSTWQEQHLPFDVNLSGRLESVAFSPDDQLLAVGAGNRIHLYDTLSGKQIREFKISEAVYPYYEKLLFSPDGKTLVSANKYSEYKSVRIWDVASGELLHDFGDGSFDTWEILIFSEDGKFLNTSRHTWDIQTYEAAQSPTYSEEVFEISPLRNYEIYAEHDQISFYQLNPQAPKLPSMKISSRKILFSPDEHLLAYMLYDGRVFLQSLGGAAAAQNTKITGVDGSNFAFSPDRRFLAVQKVPPALALYDLKTGQSETISIPDFSTLLDFSPDGKTLLFTATNGNTGFWDLEQKKLKFNLSSMLHDIHPSEDGKTLSVLSNLEETDQYLMQVQTLGFYDADSGSELQTYKLCLPGLQFSVSRDQSLVAMPDFQVDCLRNLVVYENASRREKFSKMFENEFILSFSLSADGERLVVASTSGKTATHISAWEVATGQNLKTINVERPSEKGLDLLLSADGKTLGVFGQKDVDGLALYEFPALTPRKPDGPDCELTFFIQNRGAAGDYRLCLGQLWSVIPGKDVQHFYYSDTTPAPEAYSLDKLLTASSTKNLVILKEMQTGREVSRLTAFDQLPDQASITKIAFSPDGTLLAAGSRETQQIALLSLPSETGTGALPGYTSAP